MHPHGALIETLYTCLDRKDHRGMADCYHPDATFEDIAFSLSGRKRIQAMWHLIAETDLRATFRVLHADDATAVAELVDEYTFRATGRRVRNEIRSNFRFRDGHIIEHRDTCDALRWGVQALGPVKGVLSWILPFTRRAKARKTLDAFLANHPEYR